MVYAVIGAPAQASMDNKRLIIKLVRDLADSVIICSEPFAGANGVLKIAHDMPEEYWETLS